MNKQASLVCLFLSLWTLISNAEVITRDDMVIMESGPRTTPAGLVLTSNENVLLAGSTMRDGLIQAVVYRLSRDGEFDSNFGTRGSTSIKVPYAHVYATSLGVDRNHDIVIGGDTHDGNGSKSILIKLSPTGNLVNSFGDKGILLLDAGGGDHHNGYGIKIQADNKIIQTGNTIPSLLGHFFTKISRFGGYIFATTRVLPNGMSDSHFGSNGNVLTSVGSVSEDHASAVDVDRSGRIIVTGYSHTRGEGDFTVVRYMPDGSIDVRFAENGKFISNFDKYGSQGRSLALQPDSRIVVGGCVAEDKSYRTSKFLIARLTEQGKLDQSFADKGYIELLSGHASRCITSITVMDDGRILAAGSIRVGATKEGIIVIRLQNNGQLDRSFAPDGYRIYELSNASIYPKSIVISANKEVFIGGASLNMSADKKSFDGALILLHLDSAGNVLRPGKKVMH